MGHDVGGCGGNPFKLVCQLSLFCVGVGGYHVRLQGLYLSKVGVEEGFKRQKGSMHHLALVREVFKVCGWCGARHRWNWLRRCKC